MTGQSQVTIRACGEDAILIEVPGFAEVLGLDAAIRSADLPGIVEAVPGGRTLLVRFDPARTSADALGRRVQSLPFTSADPSSGPLVVVPTTYDGPDLADVAHETGQSVADVVARHTASHYVVGFMGFAPGFAYLLGGDPSLNVRRLDQPRVRIPAGAVALAGSYCGIYPRSGPGGWRLIGRTEIPLWDSDADPPATLAPGSRVRFVENADEAAGGRSVGPVDP